MTLAPPMPYAGGKQLQATAIANLFPPHDHYVEPFGGALSVLLAKTPAKIETVNDLNGDLMTFWRVLRDRPDELERACALTPHSRAEYLEARNLDIDDDIERARRVWVQLTQGRGASLGVKTGWRFVHGTNRMALARYLDGYLARIAPAAHRLRGVSLESRDAFALFDAYDRPGTLFYVDPPYLASTRHGPQYAHEMLDSDDHQRLLDRLLACRGHVALSGYDSDVYHDALRDWTVHKFPAVAMTGDARTEVLWTNWRDEAALPFEVGA